eukprot:SAG31_NODE_25368_length_462_cov_1.286501_1_plen_49_part_10
MIPISYVLVKVVGIEPRIEGTRRGLANGEATAEVRAGLQESGHKSRRAR